MRDCRLSARAARSEASVRRVHNADLAGYSSRTEGHLGLPPTRRAGTGAFGGWVWRYGLTPVGPSKTRVTLSYGWSAVRDSIREHIQFPPFPPDHLGNSLAHLARLATS